MSQAKLKILELLKDDKISVEDASMLLDAIDTKSQEQASTTNSKATSTSQEDTSAKDNESTSRQDDIQDIEDEIRKSFRNVTDKLNESFKRYEQNRDSGKKDPFNEMESTLKNLSDFLDPNKRK
ncbi:SHOCT-like domain-containing protein [Staphylococcus massiliensis]|uniref:YvlB/LiaX N-terminal domain-containing protein n=1 Tax=Staphylococcus massiliensis S46 TaxID=1229783 RepID=K9B406_9STAP|nr:hypothetical protein [Staphylococcus massiliensis]EKU48505.1 hypothetical protein C273_04820 [Staphylococcus massiliensis S46]MCG3400059.1 hypothetical protein [Staphylococcus massiliensis]MCG3401781.1 hypothetical protein [Staphylococcus massiliensis]MCG3412653.1 hypothetical protein [Staphylococcus massiliensis]POA01514.1 hypothetical protein CD133_01605 [Staphylococcus massiliensis CCUG 55927]